MFTLTIFDSFISIGVTSDLIKLAKTLRPQWKAEGMSGYAIEEYLKEILTEETQSAITFDPEYGQFFAYYPLQVRGKLTKEDIAGANAWIEQARTEILVNHQKQYMVRVQDILDETMREAEESKNRISYTEEAKHLAQ